MDKIYGIIKSKTFSEINKDIGQVFFAGAVVEPIILKDANLGIFTIGLILSIFFWSISIRTSKSRE